MRDSILSNIRQSLNKAKGLPQFFNPPILPVSTPVDRETLIAQFAAEWQKLGGRFERVKADEAVARTIALLTESGVKRVLAWEADSLPRPLADLHGALRHEGFTLVDQMISREEGLRQKQVEVLETAEAGLTGAVAAIAQVGGVVVKSGAGRGRLASLLAPLHIVFLEADRFHPTLADWWPNLDVEASNTVVIAGPSRTSDIERVLTLGAHGPKQVIAICVD
ncbi:MAG: lactate utilization protein [Chloroflexi bacterium]|nr:lactate utilization protein [Chloroflexota bacterium]